MNQETCSFITDYHGNLNNVDPFLRQSAERRVQHIILGGDVAPKKMGVALSDNLAVKVDDFTDFAEHDFDVVGIAAKDLQNKGYMLFDSPCTLEDLQHLHSAVYKLSRGSGLSATESRLTWDEVLALEKIKDSYLLPYFKEGIRGMINKFISDYNKFNRGEPIKSVEEFLNGLIFRLKANTLLYNSDLHKPTQLAMLNLH